MRLRPIIATGIVLVGTGITLVSATHDAEVVPSGGTAVPSIGTRSDWIAKLVETLAMPRAVIGSGAGGHRPSPHP